MRSSVPVCWAKPLLVQAQSRLSSRAQQLVTSQNAETPEMDQLLGR